MNAPARAITTEPAGPTPAQQFNALYFITQDIGELGQSIRVAAGAVGQHRALQNLDAMAAEAAHLLRHANAAAQLATSLSNTIARLQAAREQQNGEPTNG